MVEEAPHRQERHRQQQQDIGRASGTVTDTVRDGSLKDPIEEQRLPVGGALRVLVAAEKASSRPQPMGPDGSAHSITSRAF